MAQPFTQFRTLAVTPTATIMVIRTTLRIIHPTLTTAAGTGRHLHFGLAAILSTTVLLAAIFTVMAGSPATVALVFMVAAEGSTTTE